MTRASIRLAAGTVALALPLAAAAGCGLEKKRSIKQEFAAAEAHLRTSKATSFTLRLDDAKGSIAKLIKKDTPPAVVTSLLKGSVTVTVDPSTFTELKGIGCSAAKPDLGASLAKVSMSVVVRDDVAELGELRLVGGNLYAHIGLQEIGRLAKASGQADFDSKLDDMFAGSPFEQGLADVRAGKWLELPLRKYLSQLTDFASAVQPGLANPCAQVAKGKAIRSKLFATLKPYVKITDANDSSSNRVLDVNVRARPAIKALVVMLRAEKGLPFGRLLRNATPAAIDDKVSDGIAHGTITIKNGHLSQVTVDLESVRTLSTDPGTDSVEGAVVVLDINDAAAPVTAPTDVSTLDLGKVIGQFLSGMMGAVHESASASTTFSVPLQG